MNVTLNIQNDAELRAFIKDAIKGQILAIVREEFVQIVKEEIERKLKGSDKYAFERMQKEATTEAVKSILYKEHQIKSWNADYVKPIIESIVNQSIKGIDWKTMIDTLAKEKVRSLIS